MFTVLSREKQPHLLQAMIESWTTDELITSQEEQLFKNSR